VFGASTAQHRWGGLVAAFTHDSHRDNTADWHACTCGLPVPMTARLGGRIGIHLAMAGRCPSLGACKSLWRTLRIVYRAAGTQIISPRRPDGFRAGRRIRQGRTGGCGSVARHPSPREDEAVPREVPANSVGDGAGSYGQPVHRCEGAEGGGVELEGLHRTPRSASGARWPLPRLWAGQLTCPSTRRLRP
jgi:hypothetical protein